LIDRPGDDAVAAVLRRRELLGDAGTVDGTVPIGNRSTKTEVLLKNETVFVFY
jgi:hypothetical protein